MSSWEMSLDITWTQFEVCNPDAQVAFENMCRFLFNKFFFNGQGLFHSDPNNPGIEIIPVLHQESGRKISFQAKYFTSIDYSQIKHSAKKAIQYYGDELDVIYLYCNKDLTISSRQYQDICALLSSKNISLIPITNQTILDQVLKNNTIAAHYFDQHYLSSTWFEEQLHLSLSALGPRYNGNFNVNTGIENQLNIFLCSNNAVGQINSSKKNLVEQLKNSEYKYFSCNKSLSKIINAILSLNDINRTTISECLLWPTILKEKCAADFSLISNLISEKEQLYITAKEANDTKLQEELSKEIRNLKNLLEIPEHIGLDPYQQMLMKEKILIVTGKAGVGKSQLLANAAEMLNRNEQPTILMLGSGFLSNNSLKAQIMQQLELDFSFQLLLNKLEMLGRETNCNILLMIDAINESLYRDIWKIGLPSLIAQISKFEHLKMVISVRSGYERLVFNDTIVEKIRTGEIANLIHDGFREESVEATLTFLNYYGIPFLPLYFLQAEMTNPLFLTLFCKYYTGEQFDMFSLFDRLINQANEEVLKAVGIAEPVSVLQYMVEELANIRLSKENWSITKMELFGLQFWENVGLSSNKITFIGALERSGFLNNSAVFDTEYYNLGYNLLEDFVCARQVFKDYQNKCKLIAYIKDELLKIENGQIRNYSNIDIFIVICSLYAEYYHEECFASIVNLVTDEYDYNDISQRYIESFLWRKASAVNDVEFIAYVNKYDVSKDIIFRVLIENSIKENHPLNAFLLHKILENKTLAQRDYLWTTYINGLADDEERLFQLIIYFEKGNSLNGLTTLNAELLLILFS